MEKFSQPKDYSKETALAQRVARIFGYEGLTIKVEEGGGWKTIRDEKSLTLVVDPTMLQPEALKDATGTDLDPDTQAPAQYSIYGIAHELGHVDDYLQPESDFEEIKKMETSEHIFWNILNDGVINKRLRNIPLLNSITDEVYNDILFPIDDYTKIPKHMQFLYGWLLRNVTPDREVVFDDIVDKALDDLKNVEINKKHYDMYRTLTHPDTTFGKRKEIATEYILPVYNAFLEQDKQEQEDQQSESDNGQSSDSSEQSNGNQDQQPNDSSPNGSSDSEDQQSEEAEDEQGGTPQDWDDIYEAYKNASHCGDHDHDDDDGDSSHDHDESDPQEAIKEAGEILREILEEKAVEEAEAQAQTSSSQGSEGAGSIATELELSPEDAEAYKEVIEKYRDQIHEVANILQLLTVPSIEYTSPRYQKKASTNGLKLSPRDLFNVVISSHSEQDPAIWKPVETVSKREGLSFNGLDIHLLVDASGSMGGQKADSAAACSVILMEGLASARRLVERYNPSAPKPDVRLQVALFGSSAEVVAPLGHETDPKDKGVAFTTVREAKSGSTLVADALQLTVDCAKKNPERTQLVYIITDGDVFDRTNAMDVIDNGGRNYFPAEYILLSSSSTPIAKQYSHINNPDELPSELNKQLKILASKFFDN